MDIAGVVGLLLGVSLVLGSIAIGSAPFSACIDIPFVLVVFGGSMGAVFICFPLCSILCLPNVLNEVFLNKADGVPALIEQLVNLAETARRDGLLALEGRLEEVHHSFIRLGIQMAVDGTRPEVIEDIMRTEMDAVHDLMGTQEERNQRFTDGNIP